MAYLTVGERPPKCGWPCRSEASAHVTNSDGSDSAFLCKHHKRVAAINLEQYDRIHAPTSARRSLENRRPGTEVPEPMPRRNPRARPGQEIITQDWEKEAAKKADSAAIEVEKTKVDPGEAQKEQAASEIIPPIISDIPKPRPQQ